MHGETRRVADDDRERRTAGPEPTSPTFDKAFWEQHWQGGAPAMGGQPPNPHLIAEIADLPPGSALDAGCGTGAEAIWLAAAGWQVTAVDISAAALTRAAARATAQGVATQIAWVEADLTVWEPDERFDLVTSHYAHAAMPQLAFYERIAAWVRPGGTLLLVGHGHDHGHHAGADTHEADRQPPAEATVTAATIAQRLDPAIWSIATADERVRVLTGGSRGDGGRTITLHDVVIRAIRRM